MTNTVKAKTKAQAQTQTQAQTQAQAQAQAKLNQEAYKDYNDADSTYTQKMNEQAKLNQEAYKFYKDMNNTFDQKMDFNTIDNLLLNYGDKGKEYFSYLAYYAPYAKAYAKIVKDKVIADAADAVIDYDRFTNKLNIAGYGTAQKAIYDNEDAVNKRYKELVKPVAKAYEKNTNEPFSESLLQNPNDYATYINNPQLLAEAVYKSGTLALNWLRQVYINEEDAKTKRELGRAEYNDKAKKQWEIYKSEHDKYNNIVKYLAQNDKPQYIEFLKAYIIKRPRWEDPNRLREYSKMIGGGIQ